MDLTLYLLPGPPWPFHDRFSFKTQLNRPNISSFAEIYLKKTENLRMPRNENSLVIECSAIFGSENGSFIHEENGCHEKDWEGKRDQFNWETKQEEKNTRGNFEWSETMHVFEFYFSLRLSSHCQVLEFLEKKKTKSGNGSECVLPKKKEEKKSFLFLSFIFIDWFLLFVKYFFSFTLRFYLFIFVCLFLFIYFILFYFLSWHDGRKMNETKKGKTETSSKKKIGLNWNWQKIEQKRKKTQSSRPTSASFPKSCLSTRDCEKERKKKKSNFSSHFQAFFFAFLFLFCFLYFSFNFSRFCFCFISSHVFYFILFFFPLCALQNNLVCEQFVMTTQTVCGWPSSMFFWDTTCKALWAECWKISIFCAVVQPRGWTLSWIIW